MSITTAQPIPAERLKPILRREIAKRNNEEGIGGIDSLCRELEASGRGSAAGFARGLSAILNERATVEFDTADRILTELGADLWQSELGDLYGAGDDRRKSDETSWCPTCNEWTFGHICMWCDARTLPALSMLGRKRAKLCELCKRSKAQVPGLVRGHRLCRRHEPFAVQLGPSLEQQLGLVAPRPRRPPRATARPVSGHVTREQIALLYRIYDEEHLGVPTIAAIVWEQLRFANDVSCLNALNRAFKEAGYKMRSRAESHRRTVRGRRRIGFGGHGINRALSADEVDELYVLYQQGESAHAIARAHHEQFGFDDPERFRGVFEYAWRTLGYKLRSSREATFLARAKAGRQCIATVRKKGQRPYRCRHLPLKGGDYCLHHDPTHHDEVVARALKTAAMRNREPTIEWVELAPHLASLMVPRPDRFGRQLEKPAGALARNTGMDPAVCSRLVNGKHPRVTVDTANKMLASLGLTVAELPREQAWPQAA